MKPRHTNDESPVRTGLLGWESPVRTGLLGWPGTELVAKQTRVGLRRGGGVHRRHEDFQVADIAAEIGTH